MLPHQSDIRHSVHPISRLKFNIILQDDSIAFDDIMKDILLWIENKAGYDLPTKAWNGESFSLDEVGSQPVEAVSLRQQGFRFWAARCDDADKSIPQRSWITEVWIEQKTGYIVANIRLLCVNRKSAARIHRSVPNFVRHIANQYRAILDGYRIRSSPWMINSSEDVGHLIALLESPHRESNVVVFSVTNELDKSAEYRSADRVAKRLNGASHVFAISPHASYEFSNKVGSRFSVFDQGVRTYTLGFNRDDDEPFNHPLATHEGILRMNTQYSYAFENRIVEDILKRSVYSNPDGEFRRFSDFRFIETQLRRKHHLELQEKLSKLTDDDKNQRAAQSLQDLQLRLDRWKAKAIEFGEENNKLIQANHKLEVDCNEYLEFEASSRSDLEEKDQELQKLKRENYALRSRCRFLESQVQSRTPSIVTYPDSFEGFEEWCDNNLSGSVTLLNRAYKIVRKSEFNDPSLVYKSLVLLRDYYVPMKNGDIEVSQVDNACSRLGIQITRAYTDKSSVASNSAFRVKYHGRNKILDMHVKRGNRHDPRSTLRIYFFWDDQMKNIVVGWLPSHLRTAAS